MATRKVSAEEERKKLLSVCVEQLEALEDRHIHYRVGRKKVFSLSRQGIKHYFN
jgi:hypothetical protein